MSANSGDKSRAGRQRKARFEKRVRNRLLRKSLTAPAAVVVAPVVAAAAIVAAHTADNKRVIVQYPRKRSEETGPE
jgi:redox-regulated HSP33 family molecular chaperone